MGGREKGRVSWLGRAAFRLSWAIPTGHRTCGRVRGLTWPGESRLASVPSAKPAPSPGSEGAGLSPASRRIPNPADRGLLWSGWLRPGHALSLSCISARFGRSRRRRTRRRRLRRRSRIRSHLDEDSGRPEGPTAAADHHTRRPDDQGVGDGPTRTSDTRRWNSWL